MANGFREAILYQVCAFGQCYTPGNTHSYLYGRIFYTYIYFTLCLLQTSMFLFDIGFFVRQEHEVLTL